MAGLRGIMAAMCKLLSPNLLKQAFWIIVTCLSALGNVFITVISYTYSPFLSRYIHLHLWHLDRLKMLLIMNNPSDQMMTHVAAVKLSQ